MPPGSTTHRFSAKPEVPQGLVWGASGARAGDAREGLRRVADHGERKEQGVLGVCTNRLVIGLSLYTPPGANTLLVFYVAP